MDPRYGWPPQGYPNGQYVPPPQPNGYQPNGYPVQYPQQQPPPMMQGYPASQPAQNQPRVAIPPRSSQPYPAAQNGNHGPPRAGQPQVVIPARHPGFAPQLNNSKIRQVQVQVPAQKSGQRPSSLGGAAERDSKPVQRQAQAPQRSHSLQQQQGAHPAQHRTASVSHAQRSPLQPQLSHNRVQKTHVSSKQDQSSSPYAVSQHRSNPKVVIKQSSPQSTQKQPGAQHASPTKTLPTDLTVLLLSAADEYISAARNMAPTAAASLKATELAQYYQLMATGLSCMETVLKRFNQNPRDEARLTLRYASLLVEETENTAEIDAVLAKGIALCERSRLQDLKYSMQHLQARYQFKSSHRAALKSLDKVIQDAETFQHITWVYAFRFLKVSLALQATGRPETASILQQLHAIAAHAERKGDHAIFVAAQSVESMVHVRSSAPDHIEQAQRAIAAARSHQLQLTAKELGPIVALIDCVDIACSMKQGKFDEDKMKALQKKADNEPGSENGVFSVLIERSLGGHLMANTGTIFQKAPDGRDRLTLAWLPKTDLRMLAYYLSGILSSHRERGLRYLEEGLKLTEDSLQRHPSYGMSMPAAVVQKDWLMILDWQIKFALGMIACHHEDHSSAQKYLRAVQDQVGRGPLTKDFQGRLATYLSSVLEQVKGDFDGALATYASSVFALPAPGSGANEFNTDLAILANMNRLLIVRDPSHPEHFLAQILYSQLEPLCNSHPNQFIAVAFKIIRAVTPSNEPINRQKTLVQGALQATQKLGNSQFITMCLNYMTSRFFRDLISEQAVKGAKASRQVSRQNRSVLWRAVAYGLCIQTFQRNGFAEEATASRDAFEELKDSLPAPLRGGYVEGDEDAEGELDVDMMG
ncbi:hypothetical protein EJ04DRAFT_498769 [Polyplosphaeria fusca]|uniref:Cohesin loading factor n=1 Tax=Polyplosphaeria fusca TaxID=682080 RepID=A0A9P4QTS3_9PLEO|nr:hypothetical protein EJ04DRAFT_498769 [Polyplosphaeria fusca]